MDTMTLFTTSATRSRRATASIVAGMTLAGAAAVGFSALAQAATVDTWDRLAECESNGTWDINTGNGFYGGVQFTLSSWQAVGGEGYPHQASKAEQIKRAEILQLELFKPKFAILDETDSGLDVDALRIVSEGVNRAQAQNEMGTLLITHYTRILNYIKPDHVHVLVDGRVAESGGPELAEQLEAEGYARFEKAAAGA